MGRKLSVPEPDINELCRLYSDGWSSLQLAKYYGVSKYTTLRRLRISRVERRNIRVSGSEHPNWKTGKTINKNGYIKIYIGYDWSTNYPCCQRCGKTDRKHDSHGLCANCRGLAGYHRRKIMNNKKKGKRAIITGISGQDGSYLTELLLSKNYEVHGMIRRHSVAESQGSRIDHLTDQIELVYGDLLDETAVDKLIMGVQPDEIYNLAAQSNVRISADMPRFTVKVNALGALNVLEACRLHCSTAKVYQASSSEMFGNNIDEDGFQRETTPMHPVSSYGCAKLFAYSMIRHYRRSYGMFVCNGILFNHESKRRSSNFVTGKVVKTAIEIKLGLTDKLVLGNMDSYRDWGHAQDSTRAMHMIMQHDKPDDFVISTMQTHSIRDLCEYVFTKLGMDYRDYVTQDAKFLRPEELKYLKGDSTKARTILGWKPTFTFETMLDEMIDYWLTQLKEK